MSVRTQVSPRERLRGLWALTHPGPSLMTALTYALCAVVAAHGRPDPVRLVVTVIGMIGLQFAISAFNDYCDRAADAHSHKFKPLARGVLPAWVALLAALLFAGVMVACYAPYGLPPLLMAGAYLALGVAYDVGVKSTPLGGMMLGLAFPLLPLLAWQLFATVKPALFWTFALGLALGLSIHLADALPDAASDAAAGAHGLTQVLGQRALAACWLLQAAANALVIALAVTGLTPVRSLPLLIAELVALGGLLANVLISRQYGVSERRRLRVNFALTVVGALVTAVGWLASAVV